MTAYIPLTDEQRKEKLEELIVVMHNLRFWTKYWKQYGGGEYNRRKRHWENRADELLTELGLTQHNHINAVFIAKQN